MTQCNPSLTLGPELYLDQVEPEKDPIDVKNAQRLAGALIWLSTRTRPDIQYMQNRISSLATLAPKLAIQCGKRVLRYLSGTKDVG